MTDTLDLTKWARLSEDTKKALAPLVVDFGLSASLAPALEAIKLVRERFLTSIPVYPLPEIFSKPAVFSLIEYPLFPALPDITSFIQPKILEALAQLPDEDDNPPSVIVSADTAFNLPEGPRPAEPRPLDTESKLALFALLVAILVVAGYMRPDEALELLGLFVLLMSLFDAQRR